MTRRQVAVGRCMRRWRRDHPERYDALNKRSNYAQKLRRAGFDPKEARAIARVTYQ